MPKYTFTVFTPTFNRAHTIERVYNSLCQQTFKDFEWLIVDDGSTDNTEGVIRQWQNEANFPIRFLKQANQGKHIATNIAVKAAKGYFFLTLDSDDACVPTALERFNYHWQTIPDVQKPLFSAVTTLCLDETGKPLSPQRYPFNPTDSNSLEMFHKYKINTEAWGFQRTEIMRDFLFPDKTMKTYLPEGIVWTSIARKYQTRYVNEYLRIYYVGHLSIMSQLNKSKSYLGRIEYSVFNLNNNIDYFKYNPISFIKDAIVLGNCSLKEGVWWKTLSRLNYFIPKFLYILSFLFSWIFYVIDTAKIRK